jgi:gluconolactonase
VDVGTARACDTVGRMVTRAPLAVLVLILGCHGDPPTSHDDAAPGSDGPPDGPGFGDPLAGIGTVELVQGGFQFTEGPQWRDARGDLLFTDIPANTIYRIVQGQAATVHRSPSDNANGLALDGNGAVIAAEHGSRSVTRDGAPIASMFEGKRLNSPNDVVVGSDGTIYFTDPPYGLGSTPSELGFMGVFRIAPDGALTAEVRGPLTSRPNGIALSRDDGDLFVADTADGNVYQYLLQLGGAVGPRRVFAATAGSPDGLAIDVAGNVFVATSAGIEVFAPDGKRWGAITVPMQPSNCAFGDVDHRTLYITARTALYRVRLAHPGLPNR